MVTTLSELPIGQEIRIRHSGSLTVPEGANITFYLDSGDSYSNSFSLDQTLFIDSRTVKAIQVNKGIVYYYVGLRYIPNLSYLGPFSAVRVVRNFDQSVAAGASGTGFSEDLLLTDHVRYQMWVGGAGGTSPNSANAALSGNGGNPLAIARSGMGLLKGSIYVTSDDAGVWSFSYNNQDSVAHWYTLVMVVLEP